MSIIRMRLRLLCTYTFHVGVRKRKPERIISRVSLNRALSVFFRSRGFTQLREPGKSQTVQRFGICEPRETTGASSSSSATSAGRVPRDPWSLRAPRGTRELEFHNAPHPLASCGPRVPALRRGAFPDPRRTRCARSRRMGTPKRRARFTPKPDLERSVAHPFPPASRPRPPHPRPPRSRACTSRNANSRPPWCPSARRTRAPGKMSSRWHPGF